MSLSGKRPYRARSFCIALVPMLLAGLAHGQVADTLDLRAIVPIARFESATAMDLGSENELYVADAGTDQILRLNTNGDVLAVWGGPGVDTQSFDFPASVDATNGLRILIADSGNGRVQWYTGDGVFVASVPIRRAADTRSELSQRESDFATPVAVVSGTENSFFVFDSSTNSLFHWQGHRSMRVLVSADQFRDLNSSGIASLAVSTNRLFAGDSQSGHVLVFDQFGTYERSLCSGLCQGLSAIDVVGERLLVTVPGAIRIYSLQGLLESVITVLTANRVLAAMPTADAWFLLTERALYRLVR